MSFLFHVGRGVLAFWLGRSIELVALCMHDKEVGNPKTSLEIEGTKKKRGFHAFLKGG